MAIPILNSQLFSLKKMGVKIMITCNVCGHLNPPGAMICQNCGSDLSDSPDYGGFDDDEFY